MGHKGLVIVKNPLHSHSSIKCMHGFHEQGPASNGPAASTIARSTLDLSCHRHPKWYEFRIGTRDVLPWIRTTLLWLGFCLMAEPVLSPAALAQAPPTPGAAAQFTKSWEGEIQHLIADDLTGGMAWDIFRLNTGKGWVRIDPVRVSCQSARRALITGTETSGGISVHRDGGAKSSGITCEIPFFSSSIGYGV